MVFFEDNYWQKPQAQQPGRGNPVWAKSPQITPEDILAMRAEGIKPSQAQIDAAMAYMDQNDLFMDGNRTTSRPPLGNIGNSDPFSPKPNLATSPFGRTNQMPEPKGPPVASFADALTNTSNPNIPSAVADGIASQQHPQDIWSRIAGEMPRYQYDGPSAEEMAAKEFAPQFEILKQLAGQQQQNYDRGNTDLAGMYASLEASSRKSAEDVQKNYQKATGQVNTNAKVAGDVVQGNFDQSRAGMNSELARLGIVEGADTLHDKSAAAMANQLGHLAAQQKNTADMLTTQGANAFAYGQEAADINKQAGVQRQADFLQEYINAQTENKLRELGLQGQQGAQANKYGLSIADLNRQGQDDWSDSVQSRYGTEIDWMKQQDDNIYRQAGLDLDLRKFQAGQQQDEGTALNKVFNSAMQQYGGDPGSASKIVEDLVEIWRQNPTANPAQLMQNLSPEALADPRQLALAFEFFNAAAIKER